MNDRLLLPTFFCPKPWESMAGNEATRFCTYCQKHVHNLANLSVSERLTLLSSPAGSICARYQVAIRRPAKGKEESYTRHLLKYGASVAATGAVLLVLWEMHDPDGRGKFYRVFGDKPGGEVPADFYDERKAVLLGEVVIDPNSEMPDEFYEEESAPVYGGINVAPPAMVMPLSHVDPAIRSRPKSPFVDLKLDSTQLLQLENSLASAKLTPPSVPIPRKAKK